MRDALVVAGGVGLFIGWRYLQSRRAVVPASSGGNGAPNAVADYLSGSNSPDVVLGAHLGYGPLRSAWG